MAKLIDDWEKNAQFREETLRTNTGEHVTLWIPDPSQKQYPSFKQHELGHELIFAAGIKHLYTELVKKGATEITFIPERELRQTQTRQIQGTLSPCLNPNDPTQLQNHHKGIPDGVFVYRDKEGRERATAFEADSGGSPLSNSKGYSEGMLTLKDRWAETRGMEIVYVTDTQSRVTKIAKPNRQVLYLGK